ncbi:MAG: hypothetical protein ACM3SY_22315 [Candidatus Omnitrophota bacterium]
MKKNILSVLVFVLFVTLGITVYAVEWQTILPTEIPGTGLIRAYNAFILPNGSAVMEWAWRDDQGFLTRNIPIVDGDIQWCNPGAWISFPVPDLPGSGEMQALNGYILPDGTAFHQGIWRGNQGFNRTVPIRNGEIIWPEASRWSDPLPITIMPGTGDIQALQSILFPKRNYFFQQVCRGDQLHWRTVPIRNNAIQWPSTSEWFGPLGIRGFPGSGHVLATDAFVMPNKTDVLLTVWQGNSADAQRGIVGLFV